MARNTLSWERCDVCGRRAATSECMIGGRIVRMCPYCQVALLPTGIVECRRPLVRVTGSPRSRPRGVMVNESLIEELASGKRTVRTGSRSRSRKRGRA